VRSKELVKEALKALSEDDQGAIKGYDVVFECTGIESCIQSAIFVNFFWYFSVFDLLHCTFPMPNHTSLWLLYAKQT